MEAADRAMIATKPISAEDFVKAVLEEIEKRKKRRVQTNLTWATLVELLQDTLDPKPEEEDSVPSHAPPVIPREFPKLKVLYDAAGNRKEFIIVQNFEEETMYHAGGWFTRPMAELETLKADGIQERPLSEQDRRRDKFKYANP